MSIPRIIHQVWEGRTMLLPEKLSELSETWKSYNPQWEYRLWNNKQMEELVAHYFPELLSTYNDFPEGVQRWDAIRYMILYIYGGVYADLDSECLEPLDKLLDNKSCCFGMKPPEHCALFNVEHLVGNAFMAAEPQRVFFKKIIEELKKSELIDRSTMHYVMKTTGPLMLNKVYQEYPIKEEIELIPYELVTPLTTNEIVQIFENNVTVEVEDKIQKAYAIHYFFNMWVGHSKGQTINNWLNPNKD